MIERLPDVGYVFWPVGTGDSTTVCIDPETVLQVDIHDLACADDDDDPRCPVIDHLIDLLPKRGKKPYLAVFVLTHPDQDHCRGFRYLLKKVTIGEIWFSPRIFRENSCDLCRDAKAFLREAERRVQATIDAAGDDAGSGDRVRIIGYSDLLDEEQFSGFPEDRLHSPGQTICEADGVDCSDHFSAFLHAPFKDDDLASERNETSIGMRVELLADGGSGRALLLGDLSYPTVRRVFDESAAHDNEDKLAWDVLLSPHQCSKSVMYWQGPDDQDEKLMQDILDDIERAAEGSGWIIASSDPVPSTNKPGDNPPHAKARARYREIAPDGFLCTGSHPTTESPEPIVFAVTASGLEYVAPSAESKLLDGAARQSALAAAIAEAQAGAAPPTQRVGYGAPV